MAEMKTKKERASVTEFINGVDDKAQRADCKAIMKMMKEITGERPAMWGPSMIGYGSYHYKYDSGREGDWFITGFSPRKQNLSVYVMSGFDGHDALMKKLGKHKTGRSCLYIKTLEDVDTKVLKTLIKKSVAHMRKMYK